MKIIVLEGVDASGKSTLAKVIAEKLGIRIQPSEGPPHYKGEMNERVKKYLSQDACIYDRHPCVSQLIYGKMRSHNDPIHDDLIEAFYASKPIFIYCDPGNKGLNGHVHKPNQYDSEEHLRNVEHNYNTLLSDYRWWAIQHARYLYRIGDHMSHLADIVSTDLVGPFDPFADINAFHNRFLLHYDGPPRALPDDIAKFRIQFMVEELCEYVDLPQTSKQFIQSVMIEKANMPDLEQQFDALIDLVYVALGTAYLQGFDFREGWRRVQAANMKKVRAKADASDSKRASAYDVVKPEGWQPPILTDLVSA